jgi:hypothetical protein
MPGHGQQPLAVKFNQVEQQVGQRVEDVARLGVVVGYERDGGLALSAQRARRLWGGHERDLLRRP